MRPVTPRRFAAELVENLNATGMLIAFGEDCFERAMYKALSGANAQSRRLEVAAQDLPNVNTSRYKGQRLAFIEVLANRLPVSERPGGLVAVGAQKTSVIQGEIQTTSNPFHLAIAGWLGAIQCQSHRWHGGSRCHSTPARSVPAGDGLDFQDLVYEIPRGGCIASDSEACLLNRSSSCAASLAS